MQTARSLGGATLDALTNALGLRGTRLLVARGAQWVDNATSLFCEPQAADRFLSRCPPPRAGQRDN